MSVEAMTWSWSQTVGDAGAKAVLVALANFADEDGRCWPGVARLAHMTDQSERTVRRHLGALIEGSFIRREPRYHPGTGARDRDAFLLLAPPEQLAKTRGAKSGLTPRGQPVPSGQVVRAPRPNPGDSLTAPPARTAPPPGQSDMTPRTTVATHKDDPSKNHQRTPAREDQVNGSGGRAAGDAGSGAEASELGAAEAARFWDEHRPKLRGPLGMAHYRAWIMPLQADQVSAEAIRLVAPSKFFADHVTNHFERAIEVALERRVSIRVEAR